MIIKHVEINGVNFYNVTADDLSDAGVELNVVNNAVNDEKWRIIKERRQCLLLESDWTQGKDCPLSQEKIEEFAAYRQVLRNIPQTYTNPDDVISPTKPTI